MVAEVRPDYPTEWATINAVATKLGIGAAETLRTWVRQAQIDEGSRPGRTTEESAELKRLRRENAELRRANEILKAASLDSNDQRNTARGWVDSGSDGSAGDVGCDEGGLAAAVARR
jgi:transposase